MNAMAVNDATQHKATVPPQWLVIYLYDRCEVYNSTVGIFWV